LKFVEIKSARVAELVKGARGGFRWFDAGFSKHITSVDSASANTFRSLIQSDKDAALYFFFGRCDPANRSVCESLWLFRGSSYRLCRFSYRSPSLYSHTALSVPCEDRNATDVVAAPRLARNARRIAPLRVCGRAAPVGVLRRRRVAVVVGARLPRPSIRTLPPDLPLSQATAAARPPQRRPPSSRRASPWERPPCRFRRRRA
jgi:hypothetical protein